MVRRKLGRGLGFLISEAADAALDESVEVPLDQIDPNPFQPRVEIDPEALKELEDSIATNGVLQPVLLRRHDRRFQLVAGERRVRACRNLARRTIPALIRDLPDEKLLEIALVENLQRENLNPIEAAQAYKTLLETWGLTQEEAARRLGKKRSTIANTLRLLDLPKEVQDAVSRGTITMGHARAILSLTDDSQRLQLLHQLLAQPLSVRETERLASQKAHKTSPKAPPAPSPSPHIRDAERRLRDHLGTKVSVHASHGRGKITIHFHSTELFNRLYELLLA